MTTLDYTQSDIPVKMDSSLNLLLPILVQPIVQKTVDGSNLRISTASITNPQQTSFGTKLTDNITNAGPCKRYLSCSPLELKLCLQSMRSSHLALA